MQSKILFLGPDDSPVFLWLKERGEDVNATSRKITADFITEKGFNFIISYGYRHILKADVLDLVPDRAINLHISLLPFNRGADPNFWSFVDDTPKGVSIHTIDSGIDTGPVIAQKEVFFESKEETLGTSYRTLQLEIQQLFYHNWNLIKQQRITGRTQTGQLQTDQLQTDQLQTDQLQTDQPQTGQGTFHKRSDKDALMYLMEKDGWDTKVSQLTRRSKSKTEMP